MENVDGNDVFVRIQVKVTVETHTVSFTRTDVLNKLYKYAAEAAAAFGPYSDQVDALDDDIAAVKDGAALADYQWVFNLEA